MGVKMKESIYLLWVEEDQKYLIDPESEEIVTSRNRATIERYKNIYFIYYNCFKNKTIKIIEFSFKGEV